MTPAEFRTARQALGLSLSGMARALGLGKHGKTTVQRFERGKITPSPATIRHVRDLLIIDACPRCRTKRRDE